MEEAILKNNQEVVKTESVTETNEKEKSRWEKFMETISDADLRKHVLKTTIGTVSSVAGIKSLYDVPAYFKQRFMVRGMFGKGKGLEGSIDDLLSSSQAMHETMYEYKDDTEDEEQMGVRKSIDDLNKRLSMTREGLKKRSDQRNLIAKLLNENRMIKKESDELRNEQITEILDDYTTTKVTGIQAARESLNTFCVASGAFAARGIGYGIMDGVGRYQKLSKEEKNNKEESVSVLKDVVIGGIKETIKNAFGNGSKAGAKEKIFKGISAWGKIVKYAGMIAMIEWHPDNMENAFKKALDALEGKQMIGAVGDNFKNNFLRSVVGKVFIKSEDFISGDLSAAAAGDSIAGGVPKNIDGHLYNKSSIVENKTLSGETDAHKAGGALIEPETVKQSVGEKSAANIAGENKVEAYKASSSENLSIEIREKGADTLSEAVKEYFKQKGVSDTTKDNFIKHWLGDKVKINEEDRKALLNKAVRTLSVGNIDMNDNIENVKNLVYEGNMVSVNSDGTVDVAQGGGISEAKEILEAKLRQNAIKEIVPAEGADKEVPLSDNLSTPEASEQIAQAEAINRMATRVDDIYKWTVGPLKGSQIEEWAEMKNRSAEEILEGKFGEPVGVLDYAEMNNREELQKYAIDAKELIGNAKQGETIKEFAQRYEMEVIKGSEELENKIFETGGKDVYDLIKIPSNDRSNIIRDYYQAISGFSGAPDQANLIMILYNPKNRDALVNLIGKYNEELFQNVKAHIDSNGNLEISYRAKENLPDIDLIITKNGKIAVDGYMKNNWPDGVDVDNPTKLLNKQSLKNAMIFINKGESWKTE